MYQICVSGAAKGKSVKEGEELALAAGRAIATSGNMLLTGATIGLPHFAAIGCKEAGGISVGISPASSKIEHVKKYRLPTEAYDVILYSGLNYVGRDALLVASSDAVVSVGGRLGTLHEFTIAIEMDKPVAFLQGAGGISTEMKQIVDIMHASGRRLIEDEVIFDDDPDRLVNRLVAMLNTENASNLDVYFDEYNPKES